MKKFNKVRQMWIKLADDEWSSSGVMDRIARRLLTVDKGPADEPLVVTVNEHAGWYLCYAKLNGEARIIGSANESAVYPADVNELRQALFACEWEIIEDSNRDHNRVPVSSLKGRECFDHDGYIYVVTGDRCGLVAALREDGTVTEFAPNTLVLKVD